VSDINVRVYRELFVHRDDVFAEQQKDGAYFPVKRDLEDWDIEEHLAGFASYGCYVIDPRPRLLPGPEPRELPGQTVRFAVFDLDTYDESAYEHLVWCLNSTVNEVLGAKSSLTGSATHKCLLMESSGGKGYHAWLFFSEPLPAAQVRRWLGWAFWPLWLEAATDAPEWPAMEVFPKQDFIEEGGFGNLVKLPLGKHAKSGNRSVFNDVTDWATGVSSVVPLDVALVPRSDEAPEGAVLLKEHRPRTTTTPFPCVDAVLDGATVVPGIRDNAVFHLALFLFGQGIDEELAVAQCLRTNERFPKPLPEREVRTKVKSAYSGRHRAGCGADWLKGWCPGPCTRMSVGRKPTEGALGRIKEGDPLEVQVVGVAKDKGRMRIQVSHPDAQNRPTLVVG
jgi:hypothetical protein